VALAPAEAFRLYTERLADWWPLDTHALSPQERGAPARAAAIEPFVGGRFFEVMADGSECDWGEVLVWDPPHRLVHSWQLAGRGPGATEVEVVFEPVAGGTRVALEHRGWEIWGAEAAERRSSYANGWAGIFARLAEAT
jgi:uncharacterized protein YndB with AHSA1/START domain